MEFTKYLSYEEYQSLGGSLAEQPFELLEYQAEKKIDEATHGRITKVTKDIKFCVFALINEINKEETQGDITSESLDGYTVQHKLADSKETSAKINKIIETYLINAKENGIPLLYMGE